MTAHDGPGSVRADVRKRLAESRSEGVECECPPCPGRGTDGHGMTHCAECCFGSGVEADEACPVHGRAAAPVPDVAAEPLTVEWAMAYARRYWKHGNEPESQAALHVLANALSSPDVAAERVAAIAELEAAAVEIEGHVWSTVTGVCSCGAFVGIVADGVTREQHMAQVVRDRAAALTFEQSEGEA